MVVVVTEVEKESVISNHPLLSIIIPVYNGSKKIESTLEKIKSQIEKLRPAAKKLVQMAGQEAETVYTGRKIISNASAAMLLDKYLFTARQGNLESDIALGNDSLPHTLLESVWYEIIVVNDGSKDDTRKVLQRIASTDGTIRLISYSENMGKGYAIRQGVLHSIGKYILFLDGDGEISTEVLSKYLDRMSSADIVIGSKYHPLSVVSVPSSRKFFSKCFHLFVKITLGIKVSDTQVGLKAGSGDKFRKIFQRVTVRRYAFDAEMLAVAGILGFKIVELPVRIDLDKSFKKKEILKMATDVLSVAFRLRVIKWYQKTMEKQRPSCRVLSFA